MSTFCPRFFLDEWTVHTFVELLWSFCGRFVHNIYQSVAPRFG